MAVPESVSPQAAGGPDVQPADCLAAGQNRGGYGVAGPERVAPPALRRDEARADQLQAGEEPRIVPGEWADLQQPRPGKSL